MKTPDPRLVRFIRRRWHLYAWPQPNRHELARRLTRSAYGQNLALRFALRDLWRTVRRAFH